MLINGNPINLLLDKRVTILRVKTALRQGFCGRERLTQCVRFKALDDIYDLEVSYTIWDIFHFGQNYQISGCSLKPAKSYCKTTYIQNHSISSTTNMLKHILKYLD